MIDEKSRRKESFDQRNSVPVVLADGQTWHLPKPWLELHPVFRDGKVAFVIPHANIWSGTRFAGQGVG